MAEPDHELRFPEGSALDFLRRVWRLNHALGRASRRMDRALGLTAEQRFLLRYVGRFPGLTPGDAARALHVDPGTVTSTLRRLEDKGLVERGRDPEDSRRSPLHLTRKGRRMDTPAPATVEAAVDTLLLEVPPAELATAVAVIERLVELLDAEDASAP